MTNAKNRTTHSFSWGIAGLLAILLCGALGASAQAPAPDSPAIEAKAHALVARLTLEEKIKLLGGVDSMFTQAVPSIGLPRFKMSDASVGVRTWDRRPPMPAESRWPPPGIKTSPAAWARPWARMPAPAA